MIIAIAFIMFGVALSIKHQHFKTLAFNRNRYYWVLLRNIYFFRHLLLSGDPASSQYRRSYGDDIGSSLPRW
jgi:hypothetical protein